MICCHAVGCEKEAETKEYVRIPYFPYEAYYCRKHSTIICDMRDKGPYGISDAEMRQKEHETRNILSALLE